MENEIKDEKTPETIVEKTFDKQTIISMLSDDSKTFEDFVQKFPFILALFRQANMKDPNEK